MDLRAGLALSGLDCCEFWLRYVALGGTLGLGELVDDLVGRGPMSVLDHDMAAHALNEYLRDHGLYYMVLYAADGWGAATG